MKSRHRKMRQNYRLILYALHVLVLVVATVVSPLTMQTAKAAQLTGRSVAINDSRFSQTGVTYTFTLKLTTLTNDVEGVKIQSCTTALGACTAPTTFSWNNVANDSTEISESGWDGAGTFSKSAAGANDCAASASVLCLNRTDTTVENDTNNRVITVQDVVNASDVGSNNTENVFLRISIYNNNTWTASAFDTGTVVTAMVNELSVTATVEESLTFCLYTGANCAAGGSSVDLGTQTTASTDTDSNTKVDIAANANNGISVGYYSTQTLTSGSNTIDSATAAGETDDPGADEMFGFCAREAGAGIVNPVAPYSTGCTDNATSDDTYAFDATNTFDQIASSAGASDTSTLTLQFGTDIVITTESGIYTTTARFVAVPTY